MFQKTTFLLFWKDTIAADCHGQNQNWGSRRNEKIMISILSKFYFKKANLRDLEVFRSQYFGKLVHTLISLPGNVNFQKAKGINKED